jgi:meiotic recombination protein DMC1
MVLAVPSKKLLAIKGISDAKCEKILECARQLKPVGFLSGSDFLLASTRARVRITTGSKELDRVLGGGIETGSVTEFFGEFRCGKTQIAATLAVTCQLTREDGGAAGKVLIMDTENAFRPERIAEIATKRYGLDGNMVLDNVLIARCHNHEQQCEMLQAVAAKITDAAEPFKLLVVDSIMGLFRVEFAGRGELSERQQKLGQHVRELVKIAAEFNVAVVVTNQVTADPGNMFVADAKKPIGGNLLAHYVHTRVYLKKGKGNQRIAKIYAGPLPEEDATFAITEGGICDVD